MCCYLDAYTHLYIHIFCLLENVCMLLNRVGDSSIMILDDYDRWPCGRTPLTNESREQSQNIRSACCCYCTLKSATYMYLCMHHMCWSFIVCCSSSGNAVDDDADGGSHKVAVIRSSVAVIILVNIVVVIVSFWTIYQSSVVYATTSGYSATKIYDAENQQRWMDVWCGASDSAHVKANLWAHLPYSLVYDSHLTLGNMAEASHLLTYITTILNDSYWH